MELKLKEDLHDVQLAVCSNRTFMELKQRTNPQTGEVSEVLIAPLWN